jgi:hypothetical protein
MFYNIEASFQKFADFISDNRLFDFIEIVYDANK